MINESKFFCGFFLVCGFFFFFDKLLEVFYMENRNSFLKLGHIWVDLQDRGRSCIPHT